MNYGVWYSVAKLVYPILRPTIKKAIGDTANQVDDFLLLRLDDLFGRIKPKG